MKPTESRDRGGKMMRAFSQNKVQVSPDYFLDVFIFNLKNLCIMEQQKPDQLSFFSLRGRPEKKLSIGNSVFLIGKTFVAIRKNLLCQKDYHAKIGRAHV